MPEQIQNIINRILEWWKKFTRRQQVLIVSLAVVVIAAISIMAYVVSRPETMRLITCDDATQAQAVGALLDGEGIAYTTSQDGFTYFINTKDEAAANILLGTNKIPSSGYSLTDVIDGSFSTTEADKQKRYQLYLEDRFATFIETLSMVKDANVTLNIPDDDGTLIARNEPSYAAVILELTSPMEPDVAAGLAQYIATELGNDNTDNIQILDTNGNVLFSGGESSSIAGKASSNQSIRDKREISISQEVRDVILATNVYDNVEVGMNLDMNFDQKEVEDYYYYVAEGASQGYLDSETISTSSSTSGVGGVPGTTSNDDDTTYVIEDGENSSTETSDIHRDYLPNETITRTVNEVGVVNYAGSSIAVVATNYVMYKEDELKANGQLDDMTFDQFVAANNERVQTEVNPEFITAISNATGFPEANISMVAYEIPMFQYSEGSGRTVTDYLQIVLAVLIFLMLAFVVFRSLQSEAEEEEEEVEQEVTIEDLIATTQEEGLEDIGYQEKSEARLRIEEFVDANPEAVANLLRNWLNEDWGF